MRLKYNEQQGVWHKMRLKKHTWARSYSALVEHRKEFEFFGKCNGKLLDGFKKMSDMI